MTVVDLARELGTTDRTLRRMAKVGTIGAARGRGGLQRALVEEESYLRAHWEVLSRLRQALRTEPRVVAALIFGSVAVGHDTAGSDLDLVVALDTEPTLRELHRLRQRLASKVGRRIDLFNLTDLLAEPDRLAPIVDDARPVVDRAGVWPRLREHRRKLARRRPGAARPRPKGASWRGPV